MSYLKTPVEEELERDDVTLLRGQPAYDVADLVRNRLPQRLANMVSAMTAGLFVHVPFVPVNKACQYCDYAAGCAVRGPVAAERRLRFAAGRAMTGLYLPDVETP